MCSRKWQWLRSWFRQANLFRAEQQCYAVGGKFFANQAGAGFQALHRMMQLPVVDRGGSNDQRAIGDGLGNAPIRFGIGQQGCRSYCRAGLAKCYVVRADYPHVRKPEITHGTRRCSDVQRVARGHQHHTQTIELLGR